MDYISPFTGDFAEVPEDYDENGELNEQGKKKLEKLTKLIKIMQDYEKVDSRKWKLYKKKLEEQEVLKDDKWQENLKIILAEHKRGICIKDEDEFKSFTLAINLNEKSSSELFTDLLEIRIPQIHAIELAYISENDIENVKIFLEKSFPNRLDTLIFNFSEQPKGKESLLNLEHFIDYLVDISLLVNDEIKIWNCSITAEVLNKLVVHFCHLK